VLPFYSTSLTDDEEDQMASIMHEPTNEQLAKVLNEYTEMDNFWKRYNKVLLDNKAVEREKKALEDENQKLRILLKQYLDGISVSDEIMSQKNPLVIVSSSNRPMQLSVPVGDPRVQRQSAMRIPVVEAAHVVKKTI
jgi:hypothetical protein